MAPRIGGFRTPEAAERYYEIYDEFVATHWSVPHEELVVPTRFGPTHVRRSGGDIGTPLVLLHPTTGSSLGWHSLIAPLSERHPVYTPDTIGAAGRSRQTAPITSAEDLSAWLDDVLDELDLERVHLCGYSEGGWIAGTQAATTERSDRLASLTLIEPGGAIERVPRRTIAAFVTRGAATLWSRDKPRAIQEFSRWMNGDIELSDDEIAMVLFVFRNFRQKLPTPDRLPDERLRGIAPPTLLLLAENTRLLDPNAVAERATRLIRDVTVDITPNAGHGLPIQYPERTASLILGFIENADRSTSPPSA